MSTLLRTHTQQHQQQQQQQQQILLVEDENILAASQARDGSERERVEREREGAVDSSS